jgi:4-hydroxy-2-oxoheptanedioate aldolase
VFAWQKRENTFKRKMSAGQNPIAVWLNVPWAPLAEIFGSCGLDGALIDMEHTSNDFGDIERLIIACDCAGVTPIVRPPEVDTHTVNRLLDAGAMGIVFPDIRTVEDATLAASCTKYPPLGRRGWGGSHTRYAMWEGQAASVAIRETSAEGRGVYSKEYVEKSNSDILTFLLVESPEGVDNIDGIAAVPGIDSIAFGWADYSVQTGFDADAADAAAQKVYDACRNSGIGTSFSVAEAASARTVPRSYFICGIDTLIISGTIRRVMDDARRRIRDEGERSG